MKTAIASLACFVPALLTGCGGVLYDPPVFSRDGSTVAYFKQEMFLIWPNPDHLVGSVKMLVQWSTVDAPGRRRSATLYAGSVPQPHSFQEMAFSPNSKRLAVWTDVTLKIIDLAGGTARELVHVEGPSEEDFAMLESVAWLGDAEIAYVTRSGPKGASPPRPTEQVIHRLRLDPPGQSPKRIRQMKQPTSDSRLGFDIRRTQWSPDGRWVLLVDRAGSGLTLLDLTTGRAHAIDRAATGLGHCAWRGDSTAVLCRVGQERRKEPVTWLIRAADRRVTDLTAPFDRVLQERMCLGLTFLPGDKHVLLDTGLYVASPFPVIRLHPFAVWTVGRRAKETVGLYDSRTFPSPPSVVGCAVPGHVVVRGADKAYYLFDVQRKSHRKIPGGLISPQRRHIVNLDEDTGKLTVSPLAGTD